MTRTLSRVDETGNPERALWCAVIRLAVEDLDSTDAVAQADARRFLFGRDRDLDGICNLIDLDADALRDRIRAQRKEGPRQAALDAGA